MGSAGGSPGLSQHDHPLGRPQLAQHLLPGSSSARARSTSHCASQRCDRDAAHRGWHQEGTGSGRGCRVDSSQLKVFLGSRPWKVDRGHKGHLPLSVPSSQDRLCPWLGMTCRGQKYPEQHKNARGELDTSFENTPYRKKKNKNYKSNPIERPLRLQGGGPGSAELKQGGNF